MIFARPIVRRQGETYIFTPRREVKIYLVLSIPKDSAGILDNLVRGDRRMTRDSGFSPGLRLMKEVYSKRCSNLL